MYDSEKTVLSRPALVLIMGVAGVGKSTLSQALCQRVHLTYLSTDPITDPFFPDTRESKEYQEMRPLLYEALYRLATENLTLSNSVLLDAPHVAQMKNPEWVKQIKELARKHNAELKVIRCSCSEDELRRRMTVRAEARDLPKLNEWAKFLADQPLRLAIPIDHLDIDTQEPLQSNLSKVLAYLNPSGPS